jgi:hypothetical protein
MPQIVLSAGVNTRIMQNNPNRKYALIANVGANQVNLAKEMAASALGDIPVLANGNYEINLTNPFKGEIYAYSAAGTTIYTQENS